MPKTIDFGIDLGTTNSSVALCRNGEVRVFTNIEQMSSTPSVVYISSTGRLLVGRRAYDAWIADPQNTHAEFKRWMGYSDKLLFPASSRSLSAEELSAEVLKSLRADVQRILGENLTSSVITVPAAFGSLQCDATARAAKLAGFEQAPLLQEPIAAAIAYGATPARGGQRWLVFDLGGGTLDIAIVSTRNGKLTVLEHQGNNRLGGKDIDRAIAENLILPQLTQNFALPDRQNDPAVYDRLFRKLIRCAEQSKIALSTADSAPVELFDLGNDTTGKPIEASWTMSRADLQSCVDPIIEKCLDLIERALTGARISAQDLDRILLVGGPTQMPSVREALAARLNAKLDHSLDPMTVVSQGAALFASTQENTTKPAPTTATTTTASPAAAVEVALSHERASGTATSPVGGILTAGANLAAEIRIDADGGFWSSGWLPLKNARFALEVTLDTKRTVTAYKISARDAKGQSLKVSPAGFSVAYMLPMSAPPLPHTIAVELMGSDGKAKYDPIFKRHTPLPAEAHRTYKADRTVRPSEVESTLPIKFWEVEVSEDPEETWYSGCVHIRADRLRRPLIEGTDVELTIKIDTSRKLTVEVFVPTLDQTFTDGVFVPDPPTTRNHLQQQLDICFARMDVIMNAIYAADREDLRERAETIQLKLEALAEQVSEEQARSGADPDALLAATENLRRIRVAITQLDEQIESERHDSPEIISLKADLRWTREIVDAHGSDIDKEQLAKLQSQFDRYRAASDLRGLRFIRQSSIDLRMPILRNQPWFWQNCFNYLRSPGRRFLNAAEAEKWLKKGEEAEARRDLPALRDVVNNMWPLLPPDIAEAAREQSLQSGLKGT